VEEKDLGRLLDLTRSHNISHVIVEQKFGVEKLVSSPDSEFGRRHLRQIWNKNAVSVFEVHQNPLPQQEFEVANYLIDRMMGSKIESSAGQAIYHPNNYRDVHRLFPEPRFCILTFDQFEVRIPASIPGNARLRFGLGFKQNATRFPYIGQIWMRDAKGQRHDLFSRTLKLTERFEDQHWFEEEVDLSTFAGQSVEIVFTCKATGAVEHQPYPLGVPDGIVLWSEPQIITHRGGDLDLLEKPESFTMLPVASNLNTPNRAYAFVTPASDERPGASSKLVIVPGGEARYDLLVPEKGRIKFRLNWQECHGPGSIAEVLLETSGKVSRVFQKVIPSCDKGSKNSGDEVLVLDEFGGSRSTLVFRVPAAAGPVGSQRVVFSPLLLAQSTNQGPTAVHHFPH
jgi:hypothetical protein